MYIIGSFLSDPSLKHPFWIPQWEEALEPEVLLCSAALFFSGVLCSAAGIGGGGIYVAVLMVFGKLTPHNAVPLSKAIVFFGSISSLAVNLRRIMQVQPSVGDGGKVIDFDTCRVVVPAALIGTFLGVLLNWHTKDYVLVVMLTVVLVIMTFLVMHRAWQQYHEENRHEDATLPLSAGEGNGNEAGERAPLLPPSSSPMSDSGSSKKPRGQLVSSDIALSGLLMFIVVLSGVVRHHMHECIAEKQGQAVVGVASCKHPIVTSLFLGRMESWLDNEGLATVLQHSAMTLPMWSAVAIALYYGREVTLSGWRVRRVVAYQLTSVLTGLLAGLVGVGGGLIFSPFFLLTGMDPAVAVGTSSTCVLFTSSSTTIQYVFTDRIIMSLALVYGIVTLIASYTGTSLIHFIQDRFHGKQSYITLVVAVSVALSAGLALVKFVRIFSRHHVTG